MDNKVDKKDPSTTESSESRIGLLKSRLKVAKAFCKKPHEAMKKWIAEYNIDDVSDTAEIRDKVRIGTIFRRVESDLPSVFDDQPDLFIKGRGKYRVFDPMFDNTYDWLWDVQLLEEVVEDAGAYFLLIGMAFVETPWITESKKVESIQTEQQQIIDSVTGQPAIDPETGQPAMQEIQSPVVYDVPTKDQPGAFTGDPFKYYFSPETKFSTILDYEHCPYYFKEHTMTKEHIKSKFGKDVDPSEILHTNITEIDTEIDSVAKEGHKDDMKRATVYEYYGCLPEDMSSGIKGQDDSAVAWEYNKEYHIWMTENEELQVEECKYPKKPLMLLGNYGLIHKFFRFGDAKHLMPLVSELQQYRTQILRHARKVANPKLLAATTAEVDLKALKDPNPGVVVGYTPGEPGSEPKYLQVGQLGAEVGVGIQNVRTDIEQTSGSFSLAQGSGVSQVKSPRGIETFSEASDKNVRRKRKKVARFIRELIKFQFELCAMNWDPQSEEVADIVYGGAENPPAGVDQFLQVLGDQKILAKVNIEVESLSINRVQQKQEALDLFDIMSQHPDIFNVMEGAKDLLQNGFNKKDADRYLVSMDQVKAQAVQEFISQIGQTNPQLGGALAQAIQSPNAASIQGNEPPQEFQPPATPMPGGNPPTQG